MLDFDVTPMSDSERWRRAYANVSDANQQATKSLLAGDMSEYRKYRDLALSLVAGFPVADPAYAPEFGVIGE